jgi:hypothetical protein
VCPDQDAGFGLLQVPAVGLLAVVVVVVMMMVPATVRSQAITFR